MAIDPVIAEINKSLGEGTVYRGSEMRDKVLPRITSGSLGIDFALGGGWAANQWNEIVGEASAGKTALILKTIAANQALDPQWLTAWVAAEEFVFQYAEMIGVDTQRMIIIDTNAMEEAYEASIKILDSHEVDALVIDSLPALIPMSEDEATMEDWQVGLGARLNGKFFRKGRKALRRSQTSEVAERACTGFIINQWRDKIGVRYGDPRTTPGGKAKDFAYFTSTEVTRTDWIEEGKVRVGQTLKTRNRKNKTAPPSRYGEVDFYFSDVVDSDGVLKHRAGSFDSDKEIMGLGMVLNVIERHGSYYELLGERVKGKDGVSDLLQDVDKRVKITDMVQRALAGEVFGHEGPSEDEDQAEPEAGAEDRKPQRRVVARRKR